MPEHEDDSEVQEISKEALEGFMEGLRASQPINQYKRTTDESTLSIPDYDDLEQEARDLMKVIAPILQEAMEMEQAGRDADTPLAHLLSNDVMAAMIMSIAMSPVHDDFQKARIIAAVTGIGIRNLHLEF